MTVPDNSKSVVQINLPMTTQSLFRRHRLLLLALASSALVHLLLISTNTWSPFSIEKQQPTIINARLTQPQAKASAQKDQLPQLKQNPAPQQDPKQQGVKTPSLEPPLEKGDIPNPNPKLKPQTSAISDNPLKQSISAPAKTKPIKPENIKTEKATKIQAQVRSSVAAKTEKIIESKTTPHAPTTAKAEQKSSEISLQQTVSKTTATSKAISAKTATSTAREEKELQKKGEQQEYSDPAERSYQQQVMTHIRQRVSLPAEATQPVRVELIFSYGQMLISARIVTSSGNPKIDDRIIKAILAANPFPPIPSTIKQPYTFRPTIRLQSTP